MKTHIFNLKSILSYLFTSILLIGCSTEEIELNENQELSSVKNSSLTLNSDDIIAIKGYGGYLSADDTYLKFKGSTASDDGEKFKVVNHGNDIISLLSLETGKYVSSEFTRTHGMTANRDSNTGAWERFQVHYLSNDEIGFGNTYNGSTKYMCSEGGREDAAFSRTGIDGAWEKFTIENIGDENSGGGSYTSIPAKIEAENYSSATEGRTETNNNITNVGWIDSGESLFYNINVPSSSNYTISFRYASRSSDAKFDILKDGSTLGSVSASTTGNWYTWATTSKTVSLSSGNQTIEIKATGSGWNFDYLEFELGDGSGTTTPTGGGNDVESILGDFWKITMPYDEDGNDSGNVSDPDDRNRDAHEYYDLNDASSDYPNNLYVSGGEVFFVAHCGGATTSGSIYPRCELRQLDSNGNDDLISFNNDQYLDVTVRAVQTPVEKPEVCMVQLKGSSSNEIIRVDFTEDSQRLHLTENEDTTRNDVIDYDLGDRLRVRITIDSDEVRLQLNNLDNGDSYDKTWDHNDDEGYLKVGSYVQSSITYCEEKNKSSSECTDDDRDAVGIVAVSNLTFTSN